MALLREDRGQPANIAFDAGRKMMEEAGKRRYLKYSAILMVITILAASILINRTALPVLGVVVIALIGLAGSNFLYDRGVSRTISRRFAPVLGGLAYLIAVLWLDAWTAIAVTGMLTLIIIALRLGFRNKLRGVRGSHPAQNWAEITYPVSGTISLLVGWGILGDRWLAFLPVAFVAWGDTAAGLARDCISRDNAPSVWTMAAMFAVCLVAAMVFHPYWIAAVGAMVATLAERFRPGIIKFWDDNLNIVAASLTIMGVMLRVF
jgi:dolichol kinase